MNNWSFLPALSCILIAVLIIYSNYHRTKKTMDTIEQMLNAATEGTYSEKNFDESRLSALESKFSHYFSASAASAKNVSMEKDKIKTLIADISHQTKTPISNILLYSELIAEGDLTEDMRSNVEALQQQTGKLRFLIDSLVKLSRLENGILTLSPKQEKIQPMFDSIRQQFTAKAHGKGLELYIEDTPLSAGFDCKWTTEALGNIVDNAIKYTPSGSISISATEYELFTRIDIADTGIGITEAEQAKIFSRFYRSETTKDSEGVGIGLFLAREIVSGEGGYIKLTSALDKGSTFSVFLPRQAQFLQNC